MSLLPGSIALIARQIKQLANTTFEGLHYIPSDSITEVIADLDGPKGTPYEGGVFRVILTLGADFPSVPPKGLFVTKIFHPNVSPAGEICVNTLKKDWSPEHTLAHVLQVIHCLLIVPFPESALNDEAGKLFMESYDDYAKKARLMTNIHAGGPAMVTASSTSSAVSSSASSTAASASASAPAALSAGKGNLDLSAAAATTSTSAVEKRKANGEVEPSKDAAAKKKSLKRL